MFRRRSSRWRLERRGWTVSNDESGIETLLEQLRERPIELVVLEADGRARDAGGRCARRSWTSGGGSESTAGARLRTSDGPARQDGPHRNLSTTMGHSTGVIREQCPVW